MKNLSGNELRQSFIDFFASKGHTGVKSSSLVPYDDPTLLFTNAGMVQFKDVFLGLDHRPYRRAVTAQRCLRAGGKHNDLDTVGRTARHHTFFEMMGNFSFGDYFKRDAIAYAWEFLTQVLEMPVDKLYVTVYEEDDEAAQLWPEVTGIAPERIFRIGAKDNFWAMGDTGPCGPCSEIFFDRGEQYGCDAEVCGVGSCDCDRWMEIWNLVFMQYDRDDAGVLTPLPKPSIDTGMGLERVASILQGANSNYDTDLLRGIIRGVEELSGQSYDPGPGGFPFRVIADHARACSFLIADGIMPSNEGRGYVLRRILRRAARFGRKLGFMEPFLYRVFPYVRESLGVAYPELVRMADDIVEAIRLEEERFHVTLTDGLRYAQVMIEKVVKRGGSELPGSDLFLLYDTYGFPLDLAKDIAEEHGLAVDEPGFNAAMEEQRRRARAARAESTNEDTLLAVGQLLADIPAGEFLGYETLEAEAEIVAMVCGGELCSVVKAGQSCHIALSASPFYGESGGQVGDKGLFFGPSGHAEVLDTHKLHTGLILHQVMVKQGELAQGEAIYAAVDADWRRAVRRNHSATHLLHKALRQHLGEHVHQAGSLVTPQRLRFDFNSTAPLSAEEQAAIEADVNGVILENLPVSTEVMPLEQAKATGAAAFFGDKYGDTVRVVRMGDYSMELCGGVHCASTGEIGSLTIISEGGIGAGLRRIEAVTGAAALQHYREQGQLLMQLAAMLKTAPEDAAKRLENLLSEHKALQKELEKARAAQAQGGLDGLLGQAEAYGEIRALAAEVKAADVGSLRQTMDMLRDKLPQAALVLAARCDDKAQFMVYISPEAQVAGLHAGQLIKQVAAVCGGGGGGRPDSAQAGGKDTAKVADALALARRLMAEQLHKG